MFVVLRLPVALTRTDLHTLNSNVCLQVFPLTRRSRALGS